MSSLKEIVRGIAERAGALDKLRRLRHVPNQRLHPIRRRMLLRALERGSTPRSVLFVCHGNIYRSPYAAVSFVDILPPILRSSIRVESAGFVGPGRGSPKPAIHLAEREGLDLESHCSSLITPARIAGFDWIVVMDDAQRREIAARFGRSDGVIVLGDLDPAPIHTRTIADPWDQPLDVLEASYARLRRCVAELARAAFARVSG